MDAWYAAIPSFASTARDGYFAVSSWGSFASTARDGYFASKFTPIRTAGNKLPSLSLSSHKWEGKWKIHAGTKDDSEPPMRAQPESTPEVEELLDAIKWDSNGLVPVIVQHINTGAILMQAFANRDAISATIASEKATFYSRSRSSLWTKGETSLNFIHVDPENIYLDCDCDSIIYLGIPCGPTCHKGYETCYFKRLLDLLKTNQPPERQARTTLYSLEYTINRRKMPSTKPSWTQKLLKDTNLLCEKIREEADELCRTVEENEGKTRTASEMADVLYHSLVLLAVQDVKVEEVMEALRLRFSQSGIEEKISRKNISLVEEIQ